MCSPQSAGIGAARTASVLWCLSLSVALRSAPPLVLIYSQSNMPPTHRHMCECKTQKVLFRAYRGAALTLVQSPNKTTNR
jgi:hypothetical protein